jgi:hypothetical protein
MRSARPTESKSSAYTAIWCAAPSVIFTSIEKVVVECHVAATRPVPLARCNARGVVGAGSHVHDAAPAVCTVAQVGNAVTSPATA